jgi:hypothetical protein
MPTTSRLCPNIGIDDDLRQAPLVISDLKGLDKDLVSILGHNVIHPNYSETRREWGDEEDEEEQRLQLSASPTSISGEDDWCPELKNLPSEMRQLSGRWFMSSIQNPKLIVFRQSYWYLLPPPSPPCPWYVRLPQNESADLPVSSSGIAVDYEHRVQIYTAVVAPNSVWSLRDADRTCQADVSSEYTLERRKSMC